MSPDQAAGPGAGSAQAALAELLAKQAITESLYRYCRALDRMDRPMADTVWHPDGTADYGPDIFQGSARGFLDWVWDVHAGYRMHSHQVTNVLIAVDGRRASSEAYVTVVLRLPARGDTVSEQIARGRYLDTWTCREDRWAIDHRHHIVDFTSVAVSPLGATTVSSVARRDRDDPSYRLPGVSSPSPLS